MSSAGLWPTLARRCLTKGQAQRRRPIGAFTGRLGSESRPGLFRTQNSPGPQVHRPPYPPSIPFHFTFGADSLRLLTVPRTGRPCSAASAVATMACRLPYRPNSIAARCAAAARSSGPPSHLPQPASQAAIPSSSQAPVQVTVQVPPASRTRTRIRRLLWAAGGRKGSQPAGGPAAGRSLAAVMAVPGRTSAWARLTDLRAVTVQLPVLP